MELAFLGRDRFEVLVSENSKLQAGDVFEASCFMKGWPLLAPWLLRGGIKTPPYVAGKAHGLTLLEKK